MTENVIVEQQGKISTQNAKRLVRIVVKFFENPENLKDFEKWRNEECLQKKSQTANGV